MTSPFHSRPESEADDVARAVAGDAAAFERAVLPMLTLRAEATTGQRFGEGDVCISLERTAGQPRVIVERAPDAIGLHMVREIGHDLREIEVSTPELFARLRPLFTSVTLVPRTSLAL